MLQEKDRVAGSRIVLLTDGKENEGPPYLNTMMKNLTASNVVVDSMALGSEADDRLEMLSALTGGTTYFFKDLKGETLHQINVAFVHSLAIEKDEAHRVITVS